MVGCLDYERSSVNTRRRRRCLKKWASVEIACLFVWACAQAYAFAYTDWSETNRSNRLCSSTRGNNVYGTITFYELTMIWFTRNAQQKSCFNYFLSERGEKTINSNAENYWRKWMDGKSIVIHLETLSNPLKIALKQQTQFNSCIISLQNHHLFRFRIFFFVTAHKKTVGVCVCVRLMCVWGKH